MKDSIALVILMLTHHWGKGAQSIMASIIKIIVILSKWKWGDNSQEKEMNQFSNKYKSKSISKL
jgi:hypothetical protein